MRDVDIEGLRLCEGKRERVVIHYKVPKNAERQEVSARVWKEVKGRLDHLVEVRVHKTRSRKAYTMSRDEVKEYAAEANLSEAATRYNSGSGKQRSRRDSAYGGECAPDDDGNPCGSTYKAPEEGFRGYETPRTPRKAIVHNPAYTIQLGNVYDSKAPPPGPEETAVHNGAFTIQYAVVYDSQECPPESSSFGVRERSYRQYTTKPQYPVPRIGPEAFAAELAGSMPPVAAELPGSEPYRVPGAW